MAGGIRPCDKLPCAELLLLCDDDRGRVVRLVADLRLGSVVVPRPSVAEPECREKVKFGRLWPHVARGDANADIVGRGLGVVRGDLPIPVAVEYSGVEKLEFGIVPRTARVLLPQARIRKFGLRIVIAPAEPRGGRGRVEIPPVFLGVLAVIALRPAETEDSLLEHGIASVPERERETKMLPPIAEASQAVLAPAVGARARVVERKVAPGVAVGAIVLAHCAPRAFRDVRADELPIAPSRSRRSLREPRVFGGKGRFLLLAAAHRERILASIWMQGAPRRSPRPVHSRSFVSAARRRIVRLLAGRLLQVPPELETHRREQLVLVVRVAARKKPLVEGGAQDRHRHAFVDRRLDRPTAFA